jgi:F-type H+-transporting ATPase subunit alpha
MFNSGQRPPIDVGNSVSRVGGDAQIEALEDVTGTLRLDLAQYFELQSFAQFGSDLDEATQQTLARGERTMNMLQQGEHQPVPVEEQVAVIYSVTSGLADGVDPDNIPDYEDQLREHLRNSHEELLNEIRETGELSEENEQNLHDAIEHFNENYAPRQEAAVEIQTGTDEEEEEEEG